MQFWVRVKAIVKKRNATLDGVALDAGKRLAKIRGEGAEISLRTLYGWIAKDILPRADEAQAIADVLGESVEYLVTGERPEIDTTWIRSNIVLLEDLRNLPDESQAHWAKGIHLEAEAEREKKRMAGERGKASPSA